MLNTIQRLFKTKLKKESAEIHSIMVGAFTTELGEKALTHLAETFIDRDMYQKGMTLDEVAFRQGEASAIKKIINEVNSDGRSRTTNDPE